MKSNHIDAYVSSGTSPSLDDSVARVAGKIVASTGGTNPDIAGAVNKAREIIRVFVDSNPAIERISLLGEIAGTIFAESDDQDLSSKSRFENSIQWATEIVRQSRSL